MEASAVPRAAPAGVSGSTLRLLSLASDAHLVALIRQGRAAAFEAAYDRHHRAILSFCRHLLGDMQEAEDAVQQTFLAAYHDLVTSEKPIHLRAWLFTIARNRCFSIIRARREHPAVELAEPLTEGLASQVQRRQDLRDLILDMQRLPHDQRAALVLAELDALSHEQIGEVLGVPRAKVKALVFQARESLTASRDARDADCSEIREQLATLRGGGLRRGHIRRHLRECPGCRAYRKQVERQRRHLAILLPVAPTLALRDTLLAAVAGGAGAATGGGVLVLKGGVMKALAGVLAAGVGTAGTLVAVRTLQGPGIPGALQVTGRLSPHAPLVPLTPDTDRPTEGPTVRIASTGSGLVFTAPGHRSSPRIGSLSATMPRTQVRVVSAHGSHRPTVAPRPAPAPSRTRPAPTTPIGRPSSPGPRFLAHDHGGSGHHRGWDGAGRSRGHGRGAQNDNRGARHDGWGPRHDSWGVRGDSGHRLPDRADRRQRWLRHPDLAGLRRRRPHATF